MRAVRVITAGGDVMELKNGGRVKVQLGRSNKLRLNVVVNARAKIRGIELKEPTSIRAVERYAPYAFHWSRLPRDEWIPTTFLVEGQQLKIHLYFPSSNLVTKKGNTTTNNNNNSSDDDCSSDNIPPAPFGAWGDKYSSKWWFNRNRFVARG